MSELRLSMVGLDTSHCEGIVSHLNVESDPHRVAGARVVKAFPGGSPAFSLSRNRVEGFTKTIHEKLGVPLCASLEEAAKDVDAIILTSVDGRQHREQFEVLAKAGKPVFVDKPFACSTADARAMADLSRQCGAPVMSSSMLRYTTGVRETIEKGGAIHSCEAFGPMSMPDDFPPIFWYGIHSVEVLYVTLGRGCREVRTVHEATQDQIVGQWADGRIGTVRGLRYKGAQPFGRTVFAEGGVFHSLGDMGQPPAAVVLLQHMIRFFQTGQSPIPIEDTLEIVAFIEAAETSLREGGKPVLIRR